jgi:hypothetical protein
MQQMLQPQVGSPAAKAGSSRLRRRPRLDSAAGELKIATGALCDDVLHSLLNSCAVIDLPCIRAYWPVSSAQSAWVDLVAAADCCERYVAPVSFIKVWPRGMHALIYAVGCTRRWCSALLLTAVVQHRYVYAAAESQSLLCCRFTATCSTATWPAGRQHAANARGGRGWRRCQQGWP